MLVVLVLLHVRRCGAGGQRIALGLRLLLLPEKHTAQGSRGGMREPKATLSQQSSMTGQQVLQRRNWESHWLLFQDRSLLHCALLCCVCLLLRGFNAHV